MKKFLSLICAICCISSICAREPQRGYRGFLEWSNDITSQKYGETWSKTFYFTGLSTSHGYQFNPNLFIGAGFELEREIDIDTWIAPIFAQVRTDQTWGKYTPFGDLRLGYNFTDGAGYFLSPTVGYRFNFGHKTNLNIGVGLTLRGYTADMYELSFDPQMGYYDATYIGTSHHTKAHFTFRVGIDF